MHECIYIYIYSYVCMYVCVRMCVCMCVCVCVCVCGVNYVVRACKTCWLSDLKHLSGDS